MKQHQRCFGLLLALAIIASACTGGSETATPATPEPVTQTATPDGEATATPVPAAPTVTDQERIDAAEAQLNAEVVAGEGPSDTFAYDLLDTKIDDEGTVTLTICAWTGDTVFDTVRDSLYRTRVDDDGTITATHITTPIAAGDCLNTQLIESALDFINEFDAYWTDVSADPASFTTDARTRALLTESYESRALDLTEGWVADDIYFETSFVAIDIRSDSVADILYRRFSTDGLPVLEVATCREMRPTAGAYRDGVLIDNNQSTSDPGPHSVYVHLLTPSRGNWRLAGTDSLIWSDCFATGDWPEAATLWRPGDDPLTALPL